MAGIEGENEVLPVWLGHNRPGKAKGEVESESRTRLGLDECAQRVERGVAVGTPARQFCSRE